MARGQLSFHIIKNFPSIEDISFKVLIEAYNMMIESNKYSLDWGEEQITQELVGCMERSILESKYNLVIVEERKLSDKNKFPINDNNPKKLPRIDISIASWAFKEGQKLEYFFEAKNLYENDYKKKRASQYINRYIDTGIENFRISRYFNGSLIGYVLDGDIDRIIDKLNTQLTKDRNNKNKATNNLSSFEKRNHIKDINCYYESIHLTPSNEKITIKHIFLEFCI